MGWSQQFALLHYQRELRAADRISDTAYVGGVFGRITPVIADQNLGHAASGPPRLVYIYRNELSIRLITRHHFAGIDAARWVGSAVCAQAIRDLGAGAGLRCSSHSVTAQGRPLARVNGHQIQGVMLSLAILTLDLDDNSGAASSEDPGAGPRGTSLREVLGYAVTPQTVMAAVHHCVQWVFNTGAVTTLLSERELNPIR